MDLLWHGHSLLRERRPCLLPRELTGDRRTAQYAPDGRLALMTTNQVGMRCNANGVGWGLAFETVDPAERLVLVLMLQNLPSTADVRAKFGTLVYQALLGDGSR